MNQKTRVHANCTDCAGDCVDICIESGLKVRGGLSASPERIAEIRAGIPLLRAQRFQREQLHALIDKAEEAGAWLYSASKRPYRPHATYYKPELSELEVAVDTFRRYARCFRSPREVRRLLAGDYHPEDYYEFKWTLVSPVDALKELRLRAFQVGAIADAFEKEMNGEDADSNEVKEALNRIWGRS